MIQFSNPHFALNDSALAIKVLVDRYEKIVKMGAIKSAG